MQAGVHVLCEKPLAISVAEVERMVAASRDTGRVLAEAFMYRHHPQMKTAGEWVRRGRLGEVLVVRGVFDFIIRNRKTDVRLVPEYGGGALWDIGCYPVSFAQYIYGRPPERVFGAQQVGESGVDEVFSGVMEYPGSRMAQAACSFRMPYYTSAEVIGTEGRLVMNYPYNWTVETPQLIFYPESGDPQEVPFPLEMLYLGEVEDLNSAILDKAPTYLTLEESLNHIRTLVSLYESARTGQAVRLE
jgi:predicted dehydrogenase